MGESHVLTICLMFPMSNFLSSCIINCLHFKKQNFRSGEIFNPLRILRSYTLLSFDRSSSTFYHHNDTVMRVSFFVDVRLVGILLADVRSSYKVDDIDHFFSFF